MMLDRGNMHASRKSRDWCHLCGLREDEICDVAYPENAEHGGLKNQYIRICRPCATGIALEGKAP